MAFDLESFIPYRLFQAAEHASLEFREVYRRKYGLTRVEWRVLFNVGKHEPVSAAAISRQAFLHKTKISRAVAKLEARGWLRRIDDASDRRRHELALTPKGSKTFGELTALAAAYNDRIIEAIGRKEAALLVRQLQNIEATRVQPANARTRRRTV